MMCDGKVWTSGSAGEQKYQSSYYFKTFAYLAETNIFVAENVESIPVKFW